MSKLAYKLEQQRLAEFEKLCNVLRNKDLELIALRASVHVTTLYKWLDGTTFNPHINTVYKVARAVGYSFKMVKGR